MGLTKEEVIARLQGAGEGPSRRMAIRDIMVDVSRFNDPSLGDVVIEAALVTDFPERFDLGMLAAHRASPHIRAKLRVAMAEAGEWRRLFELARAEGKPVTVNELFAVLHFLRNAEQIPYGVLGAKFLDHIRHDVSGMTDFLMRRLEQEVERAKPTPTFPPKRPQNRTG